ncbi:hypothetical protein ABZT03_30925, partial [Streptomyces sp. NPDC005574]
MANSGPALNGKPAYRKDLEPVYRWDNRKPKKIFKEGFPSWNNMKPSSLQYYQNENGYTGYVSTTRKPEFAGATGMPPVDALTDDGESYRYTIEAPGGIDFLTTLGREAAYANQEEVAFWRGIRSEYIVSATKFNQNGEAVKEYINPNAAAGHAVAAERQRRYAEYQQANSAPQHGPYAQAADSESQYVESG